jgi:hypothetical protein
MKTILSLLLVEMEQPAHLQLLLLVQLGKNSWVYGLFLSIIGTAHGAGSAGSSGTPTSSAIYHFRDNGRCRWWWSRQRNSRNSQSRWFNSSRRTVLSILNSFYTRGNNLVNQGVVGGNAGSATEQGGKTIIGRYSPGVGGRGGGGGSKRKRWEMVVMDIECGGGGGGGGV